MVGVLKLIAYNMRGYYRLAAELNANQTHATYGNILIQRNTSTLFGRVRFARYLATDHV